MKEHWLLRLTKHTWTPILLGAIVCFSVVAIAKVDAIEAAPAGLGFVLFCWIAMVKAFAK